MDNTLLRALELAIKEIDILTQKVSDADARHLVHIEFQEELEEELDECNTQLAECKTYSFQKHAKYELVNKDLTEGVQILHNEIRAKQARIDELESLEAFHSKDNLTYEEASDIGDKFMKLMDQKDPRDYPEEPSE